MSPQRIQRKRTKGWRMPEGAVYVGRPTKWGNPYALLTPEVIVHPNGNDWWAPDGRARAVAVRFYREDLYSGRLPVMGWDVRDELADCDLACWCPLDQPCHADVLLRIANEEQS